MFEATAQQPLMNHTFKSTESGEQFCVREGGVGCYHYATFYEDKIVSQRHSQQREERAFFFFLF